MGIVSWHQSDFSLTLFVFCLVELIGQSRRLSLRVPVLDIILHCMLLNSDRTKDLAIHSRPAFCIFDVVFGNRLYMLLS